MMRKSFRFISVIMAAVLLTTGLCACGTKDGTKDTQQGTQVEAENKIDAADATDLLTKVWNSYDETTEKFAVMGGSADSPVDGAPGKFPVDNGDTLDGTLGFPAAQAASIDDAASVIHMMNANTFTGAVYHVAEGAKQDEVALALKENILVRQWMCGFPERLVIWSVGDEYIACVFGAGDLVSVFEKNLTATYESAKILYDENLME